MNDHYRKYYDFFRDPFSDPEMYFDFVKRVKSPAVRGKLFSIYLLVLNKQDGIVRVKIGCTSDKQHRKSQLISNSDTSSEMLFFNVAAGYEIEKFLHVMYSAYRVKTPISKREVFDLPEQEYARLKEILSHYSKTMTSRFVKLNMFIEE